jgi:2'-5' RNA ligase
VSDRLFLALWPNAEVRSQMAAAARGLGLDSGRLIAPSNLHVTLVFLGACDAARRECVERAVASTSADSFALNFVRAEWRRKGGIVWLATPEVPAALAKLAVSLNQQLQSCGHVPEQRTYRPHVTLARNVRRFARDEAITPVRWPVREFCLVSSTLTPSGSAYSIVKSWSLSSPAGEDVSSTRD